MKANLLFRFAIFIYCTWCSLDAGWRQSSFFSNPVILPLVVCVCALIVYDRAALSDYRVEQQYRLSYHNKLSQRAKPTGRTLHQRTKEKIKECYSSITIQSQSLTGDKTQCDTCYASNYYIHRWRWKKMQQNSLKLELQTQTQCYSVVHHIEL